MRECLDRFRHAISSLFGRWIGWDVEWRSVETFLSHQFASHPLDDCRHTFISFNYDLLLDRAIQRATRDSRQPGGGLWHPSTGYGFEVNWYLGAPETTRAPTVNSGSVSPGFAEQNKAYRLDVFQSFNINLLKPHGSLNWIIRHNENHQSGETGLMFDPNTPVFLPLTNAESLDYWRAEKQECANVHYESGLGKPPEAHHSIFLIPPTPPCKENEARLPHKGARRRSQRS
jgi:hypothetical protein